MKKYKPNILKKNSFNLKKTSFLFSLLLLTYSSSYSQDWQKVGQNIGEENSYTSSFCLNENGNILAKAYHNESDTLFVKVYHLLDFGKWEQLGNTIHIHNGNYLYTSSLCTDSLGYNFVIRYNNNNSGNNIKIFKIIEGDWIETLNIEDANLYYGNPFIPIKLSSDGNTLAFRITSNYQTFVRVYKKIQNEWVQIEGINSDIFGNQNISSIDLSSNGNNLALGFRFSNDAFTSAGQVRIYKYFNGNWEQKGNIINGEEANELFGANLNLSNDGNRISINGEKSIYNSVSVHPHIYDYYDGAWTKIENEIFDLDIDISSSQLSRDGKTLITCIVDEFISFLHGRTFIYKENMGEWTLTDSIPYIFGRGSSINFDGTRILVDNGFYSQVFQLCNIPVSINLINIQNADCSFQNGSADIEASGGTEPYTYYWSNGDTVAYTDSLLIGNNSVKAIDIEGCSAKEDFIIEANDAPIITLENQTNLTCPNATTAAIDISISGNIESIAWSNGAETEDIINLSAGTYDVTVTSGNGCSTSASYIIPEIPEIDIDLNLNQATCGTSDGSAFINSTTGGTDPYAYEWSAEDHTNLSAGIYSISITDANNCIAIASFNLSNLDGPNVTVDEILPVQCGETGQILISVSNTSGTQTYDWSSDGLGDADDAEDLLDVNSGNHTLMVEDVGCLSILEINIPSILPNTPEICMVTVDTLVNRNLVVWENESSNSTSHYNIYRETSTTDSYQWIGEVQYDALSEFEDPIANPSAGASRYKISAVDNCDNESELSLAHKSFYLQILSGYLGAYDLEWENYEGINNGVYIKRYLHSSGWQTLDSLTINTTSYTDFPPNTEGLKYLVTRAGVICSPNIDNNGINRSTGGPYTQAVSNLEEDDYEIFLPTVIKHIEKFNPSVKIFPNPANSYLQVESPSSDIETLEILDITGKLIKQFKIKSPEYLIDVEDLPKGIYIINIGTSISVSSHKMIKE